MGSLSVRLFTEGDEERWSRYVDASPEATCYHDLGWKRVIERTFRHRTFYLFCEDRGGHVKGVLPMVQLRSVLFGNFLVSLPYVNYGGSCADGADVRRELLGHAVELASQRGASHLELRETRLHDDGLRVKTSKVAMHLDLPSNAEALWNGFPSKLRSQIRRPLKEGMEARVGGLEELDGFYEVFSVNMRDLGTPVYSKQFFRHILEEVPRSRICSVVYRGRVVASGLCVGFRDRLEIPWASSLRKFNALSPNTLLYWTVLKFGCDQGYALFDFGRSTPGEGPYRFKAQWGARAVPLYWSYWTRDQAPLPDLSPNNPKYTIAIKLWRRFPVALTRLVGPAIVRNLP